MSFTFAMSMFAFSYRTKVNTRCCSWMIVKCESRKLPTMVIFYVPFSNHVRNLMDYSATSSMVGIINFLYVFLWCLTLNTDQYEPTISYFWNTHFAQKYLSTLRDVAEKTDKTHWGSRYQICRVSWNINYMHVDRISQPFRRSKSPPNIALYKLI